MHSLDKQHQLATLPKSKWVHCYNCDMDMENTLKAQTISQLFGGAPVIEIKVLPKPKIVKEFLYYPRGLVNLGNTCYLNSSLQVLNSSDSLVKLVLLGKNDGLLGQCFKDYLQFMRNDAVSSVFTPKDIQKLVREKTGKFKGYSQEDSHDFTLTLLDGCIEEEKTTLKLNQQSISHFDTSIGNAFGFYIVSKIICHKCQSENWKFDSAIDLCLPLAFEVKESTDSSIPAISTISLPTSRLNPSGVGKVEYFLNKKSNVLNTISDYLAMFMSVEEINIEDVNAYFCCECAQKVSSSHQYFLYDLPECLIITLKRFVKTKDGYSKESKKIENEFTINLSKFVLGGGVHTYKLSGFTSHGGSIYGGHYVSYCYNSEEYVL